MNNSLFFDQVLALSRQDREQILNSLLTDMATRSADLSEVEKDFLLEKLKDIERTSHDFTPTQDTLKALQKLRSSAA